MIDHAMISQNSQLLGSQQPDGEHDVINEHSKMLVKEISKTKDEEHVRIAKQTVVLNREATQPVKIIHHHHLQQQKILIY